MAGFASSALTVAHIFPWRGDMFGIKYFGHCMCETAQSEETGCT